MKWTRRMMKRLGNIVSILISAAIVFGNVDLTALATEYEPNVDVSSNDIFKDDIDSISENDVPEEAEKEDISESIDTITTADDSELSETCMDSKNMVSSMFADTLMDSDTLEDTLEVHTAANSGYNASAALAYANAHWNDGVGKCASFVSACINAGGINISDISCTALRSKLLNSSLVTEHTVTLSSGYLFQSKLTGSLKPGDIVFYYCANETDGKPYVHVVMCNGFDSSGRMKAYAHNGPHDGQSKMCYYYCGYCGKTITTAHVFHFKGNGDGQQPTGVVDVIQGGEGTVRVRGWAFDYDNTSAQLDIHVYVGGEAHIIKANLERTDVNAVYGVGNYHGFDSTFKVNVRGNQQVTVYAIDTGENLVGNPEIGSATINIKNIPFSITYKNSSINTKVDDSVSINYDFTGDGIHTMGYTLDDSSIIDVVGFSSVDWGKGTATLEIKALKAGSTTLYMHLVDSDINSLYNKGIPITVTQSVTGVSLNKSSTTLANGETENLTATVYPTTATNKAVTWSSSNTSVATVSNGIITAKSAGTAVITVKTSDGGYTATCNVTVSQPTSGISLNKSSTTIMKADMETLVATVYPSNATNQSVMWSSSNTRVAAVYDGVVMGRTAGTATITATTSEGGYSATCNVTVINKLTGISFDKSSVNMCVGEAIGLNLKAIPDGASLPSEIEWTSNNTDVATIDNELVLFAKAAGMATIVAKTKDGNYSATCEVNVTENKVPPTGISLSVSSLKLFKGDSHTLVATITPSNASNEVIWESSSPSVATVKEGVVFAESVGTTTITAKTKEGGCSATCTVEVEQVTIPVKGVSLSKDSFTIKVNDTEEIRPIITPSNATNQKVIFESSNTEVIEVTADGKVIGIAPGTAVLKVATEDGNYTATCEITVIQPVTDVTLNKAKISLAVGKTESLIATIMPSDATDKRVVWSSSNTEVATVNSEGSITAKSVGNAMITAKSYDNSYGATCDVTVTDVQGVEVWLHDGSGAVGSFGYMSYSSEMHGERLQSMTWTSSDSSIISIDENTGLMQFLKPGTVTITLTINDVSASAKMKAIDIVFEQSEITLKAGTQKSLNVTILPDMEDYLTINWSSNNVDVATVNDGVITAYKEGTANIVCSYGPYKSSCIVNVIAADDVTEDTDIPITEIILDNDFLQITKGTEMILNYSVIPSNATNALVIFSTSDENIISVDKDGKIVAKGVGEANITVSSVNSAVTATCHVIVLADDVDNADSFNENNNVPEGLWITGLEPTISYCGNAITQKVCVYHGKTLLRENAEYKISYKNNKNAGTAQIIVTGKGNYTGTATAFFDIEAIDLSTNPDVSINVTTATATGKNLKPKVTVKWKGKKLKENKDYVLSYNSNITVATKEGYDITISGTGNYTGTIKRKFYVVEKGTALLNNASVKGVAKSYFYDNGNPVGPTPDEVIVKVGQRVLEKNIDYTIQIEKNSCVGIGTVIIKPTSKSSYAGEKIIEFKIIGTNLKNGSIVGLNREYSYTGKEITPEIYVFSDKNGGGMKIPSDSYTVSYSNNINCGKATVTVEGIEEKGFSGKITATYKIKKVSVSDKNICVTLPKTSEYAKGGSKPIPIITYNSSGKIWTLREGVDYSLKYSNNTSKDGKKVPTLKITGLGNYSGNLTKTYDIIEQDIGSLTITVTDKAYVANKKANYYLVEPKIYDKDGRLLKKNTDYAVSYVNMTMGKEIDKNDSIANGTEIFVTVTGKGNYFGVLGTSYYVRETKDINKVKADKVANQQYTGYSVKPDIGLFIQEDSQKNYLTEGEDYRVIGYYNNTKKGKASIIIQGIGEYSGSKVITFKIVSVNNKSIWEGIFN